MAQSEYWSHFGERLGFLPRSFTRTNPGSIWLHAVSVGEVASALPLIETLHREHPRIPIYLSIATLAGRKAAERELNLPIAGLFYAPVDYVSCVRRTLKVIRPALLIVMETEIWPNLYAETKRSGAALAIVNGRISDRSWPRYHRLQYLLSPILCLPDMVSVQSATDYDRYARLGVPLSRLHVEANLKYDAGFARAPMPLETFKASQIWIAASTTGPNERGSLTPHSIDEDEIVLRAFQALAPEFSSLLLILAPRQPARFNIVAQKLAARGIPFVRRAEMKPQRPGSLLLPGVLLLDTIGELARIYPLADVVFVGGSIAPRGGHNIIEPGSAGVPFIVGPHMHNFEAITRDFMEADAMIQIENETDLKSAVRDLLLHPARAQDLGRRARLVTEARRGVSERLARHLWPLYYSANLKPPRGILTGVLLKPLAFAWCEGGAIRRRRFERYAKSQPPLPASVASIGGITVGGSGKTPFVIFLAKRLEERGFSPAILTRGYRRRSPAKYVVFGPDAKIPSALTGDEAQILLRAAKVPIGIGTNRYQAARILLDRFPGTDILLLDDGFQHARVNRNLDIVLIDALNPFGQDELLPLGRLREPLSALSRADVLVVTRAEEELRYRAISKRLREYNPSAPIFRTRLAARHWRDSSAGSAVINLPGRRVAAFCGLGNPDSFWKTLESLGLDIVFRWAFDDHHSYTPVELHRIAHQALASGADILVTTEKDRLNCPDRLEAAIAPLTLAWLEIELELENEANFFSHIERALRRHHAA